MKKAMKTKAFIIVKVGTGWQLTALIEEGDIQERRAWICGDDINSAEENLLEEIAEYLDVKNLEIW